MNKSGLSMVEIMVAVVIIALATGPLIAVLSSSNRMSNASIYEEMAVHYGREISDQLLRLSPMLENVVIDARTLTGDSSINLGNILNDSDFCAAMEAQNPALKAIPFKVNGVALPLRLVLSPLDPAFTRRRIQAERLDTSSNSLLNSANYWKVNIELAWVDKNSGRDAPRKVSMSIIVKED
ncbi:MAG: type IV pilus modification PilV family protein [Candidatus Rifleibacteriota bacterium]